MSAQLVVNNELSRQEKDKAYEQIKRACGRQILSEERKPEASAGIAVFNKYFNKENPLLDVNAPIPGQSLWTPLAMATYLGKTEEVKSLLNLGANPSQPLDNNINVLHLACTKGLANLCYLFLLKNVDVNVASNSGITPMMRACEAGDMDVIKVLMKYHPNVLLKDNNELTCVDYAKKSKNYSVENFINYFYLDKQLQDKEGRRSFNKI